MKKEIVEFAKAQGPIQADIEKGFPTNSPTLKKGDALELNSDTRSHHFMLADNFFDSIDRLVDEEIELMPSEGAEPDSFVCDPFVGMQLGNYLIQERIGSGGMARVYLAHDLQLKRHVALKIIQNRKYVSLERQAKLLTEEAVLQASLHHPNTVSIFSVGSHEGMPYLAMEYVDGGSLLEKIKDDRLSYREILRFTGQIVSGLQEAYSIGLVHGDIKPANLLVDDNGQVKLSDFGLARHISDENDIPKRLVGTPSFMAPELFELQPIDEQSDLFSLGVTLFQLTFGKVPYTLFGDTVEEIRDSFRAAEIDFPTDWPKDIPAGWKKVLVRMLAKDRRDRYQSVSEVQQDLQKQSEACTDAKVVPKLSSFLFENAVFAFLCLPLLAYFSKYCRGLLHSGEEFLFLTALLGPFCFILLTGKIGRTFGQSICNIRMHENDLGSISMLDLIRYQVLQLSPVIFLLIAALSLPLCGSAAALSIASCGLSIAICHLIDTVVQRNHSSFFERVCRLQAVVDV